MSEFEKSEFILHETLAADTAIFRDMLAAAQA